MSERFDGSFTRQEPIPEEGIAAALEVLRHGRLHRYNLAPDEAGEAALLEREFADLTGARYCLAVASGGYAMGCALRACGLRPGEPVLTNAFTLAPVPGAIAAAGGRPVFVDILDDLTIDPGDLALRARESGARLLLLSHMRGHVGDMEALVAQCARLGLTMIEDCAHTMGAAWRGVPSGRHGAIGCYSTQTYKHVNSGEGGLLVTDDDGLAARMVLLSGSYMLFGRHLAAPEAGAFAGLVPEVPNVSGRMDNLRAAILRPQIALLGERRARWAALYRIVEEGLAPVPGLRLIPRPAHEEFVGSSFQFLLPGWDEARIRGFLAGAAARGVELKWFGAAGPAGFTSRYPHWAYAGAQSCPNADRLLAGLIDMRLPLSFSPGDAALIARILRDEALRPRYAGGAGPAAPPEVQ